MSCSAGLCTTGPTCVIQIATGETHTCAVYGGQVKCWGGNSYGQLGWMGRDYGITPQDMGENLLSVNLGVGVTASAVAAGGRHTCALLGDGRVKCWGDNSVGQLGQGDRLPRPGQDTNGVEWLWVDLGTNRRAIQIAAGLWHTCAVLDDGSIKCWGGNQMGQLGLGDRKHRGDAPHQMGDDLPPVNLGHSSTGLQVTAGAYHTCALLDTHEVQCWGWNEHEETGMTAEGQAVDLGRRPAAQVAVGASHTCAVLDGTFDIKCWGLNQAGQLGLGLPNNSIGPTGRSLATLPTVDLGPALTARAVTLGANHTCALLSDDSVRCWGYNLDGELGLGTKVNRGKDPSEMTELPEVPLSGPVRSIAAGANHTCAVASNRVVCWGLNNHGQLGVGDMNNRGDQRKSLVPVNLGP
jgi:alpha-tubulin suppressor-like RCC1 family protein